MDNFNFYPNLIPDVSCSQKLNKAPLGSSGAIGSQPCMSGFAVQTLESHLPNYVSQSDAVQNNAYSVNPLNQYAVAAPTSVSNFISTYNLVDFPPDELDVYLGTKKTASDELISTELNLPTDTSTPLHGASCSKTSVNFSQSSTPPVAIVNPQQKAQTDAESDNPLLTSSKGKAAKPKYKQSPARKAAKDKYRKSAHGKAAMAKYEQSPARKASRKEYDKSPARQAARKEYQKSPAGKAAKAKYHKSPAGKAAKVRYNQSPAGKAAKAIQSAKYSAYKKELVKSGNKEIAKQKGKEAAERKRLLLQNKSVDQIVPPLFSRQTEGIYTVPIELISP